MTNDNNIIPVAIYARYSSDMQNPLSIEDQVAACRALVAENEKVTEVFKDAALTGRTMNNREGLQNLLDEARAGLIRAVYTEGLDRLSRNSGELGWIKDVLKFNDCDIRTVIDGLNINGLTLAVKGAINESILEDIKVRTKRGHIGNIRRGKAAGSLAYGYRKIDRAEAGLREIHPDEAPVVREIFGRFVAGESPACIVDDLNRRKIPAKRGGRWQQATILGRPSRQASAILKNEQYTGKLIYNRNSYPLNPDTGRRSERANPRSEWEICDVPGLRIVSDELFAAAQKRIKEEYSQIRQKHRPHKPPTLSPIMHCVCGRRMHSRGGDRYRCNGHRKTDCGRKKSIRRDDVLLGLAERIQKPQWAVRRSSRTETGKIVSRVMDKLGHIHETAEGGGVIDQGLQKAILGLDKMLDIPAPSSAGSARGIKDTVLMMFREQTADLVACRKMDELEELVCLRVGKIVIDIEADPPEITLLRFK